MKRNLANKCLGGLALSVLCLSVTNSFAGQSTKQILLPDFTPFNLEASTTGYIVKGTIFLPGGATTPGTMVIDTPNQRVAFWFGDAGNFVTTTAGTYNWNLQGSPVCYQYKTFDYNAFKNSYAQITSTPGANKLIARYTGYTQDSASCNQNITYTLIQAPAGKSHTPIILELDNALPVALPGACVQGQAYWVADPSTVDTTSSRDSYFQLPANCSAPQDYCSTFYPIGNSCAIP